MADSIDTFSIRIDSSIIDDFRKQAKEEHITQGKLFKKVLNLYLGRGSTEEERIPFSIHLFRFNNVKHEYLKKKIYDGYGVPLYFSPAFRFYGWTFSSDKKKAGNIFGMEDTGASSASYRHNYSSELAFIPGVPFSFKWVNFASLDPQASEEFEKDIGINSPCYFMSAFRVFKEWTNNSEPFILVNEHMYLVESYIYDNDIKRSLAQDVMGIDSKNLYNPNSASYNPNEPIRAEDLLFSMSALYRINDNDISNGEEILRLDRKYLNPQDVINLKNVLKPRITKRDKDLDAILAEYSIWRD